MTMVTTPTMTTDGANFVKEDYFDWLCEYVTRNKLQSKGVTSDISYNKLFEYLFSVPFTWTIDFDENRAGDGYSLRDDYSLDRTGTYDLSEYIDSEVSVFEVIIALAIRCEEAMDDPDYGNRTRQWFWEMLNNLGVADQYDQNFDLEYVDKCVTRFLNREYEPNGRGGLFIVRHTNEDLRDVELWYQMNWYLNEIP